MLIGITFASLQEKKNLSKMKSRDYRNIHVLLVRNNKIRTQIKSLPTLKLGVYDSSIH